MNCPIGGFTSCPTAQAAWNVIRFLTGKRALLTHKQPGTPGGFAYRCAYCHQWHITRQRSRHRPADWPRHRQDLIEREART